MHVRALIPLLLAGAASAALPPIPNPTTVVVDQVVVGEFTGKRWQNGSDVQAGSPAGGPFVKLGLDRITGRGRWGGFKPVPGNGAMLAMGAPEKGVVVTGKVPKVRPVRRDPAALSRCRRSLQALLRARGARTAPVQAAGYSVDLDGDGKAETLLSVASRRGLRPGAAVRKGDYSALVLLPAGASTVSAANLGHFGLYRGESGTDLWFHEVRSVADVDGDGRLEVILSTGYQLGPGAKVVGYRGGRAVKLAEAMNDEP